MFILVSVSLWRCPLFYSIRSTYQQTYLFADSCQWWPTSCPIPFALLISRLTHSLIRANDGLPHTSDALFHSTYLSADLPIRWFVPVIPYSIRSTYQQTYPSVGIFYGPFDLLISRLTYSLIRASDSLFNSTYLSADLPIRWFVWMINSSTYQQTYPFADSCQWWFIKSCLPAALFFIGVIPYLSMLNDESMDIN